jgi:leader peptidase (prepilin peptidase)/N-methyltransferase
LEIFLIVIFGFLGAAFGSFINVCVYRLPEGKSLISPPSYCDSCRRSLTALDLIPVLSFVFLRGRCRTCQARIPAGVFWVELGCGLWLAFLFWFKGLSLDFVFSVFYSFLFLVIALIDIKHRLILNKVLYPSLIIGLVIAPFFIKTDSGGAVQGLISALIGAAVGFAILSIPYLLSKGRGMGFGDVKLAALIGLATGFGMVVMAVLISFIAGGIIAVILILARIKNRKEAIPFGPFLAAAAVITLLWGPNILKWWLAFY